VRQLDAIMESLEKAAGHAKTAIDPCKWSFPLKASREETKYVRQT